MGRGEKKGWAPIEYSPHHSELTGLPAIRKLCFPVHLPSPYPAQMRWTWGCLPSQRAGLNNCRKPTTPGAFPALACLPSGGATPPRSSTKHHQPPGKGLHLEKLEQAQPGCEKSAYILRQSFRIVLPWGRVSWVCSCTASHSSSQGDLHSNRTIAWVCKFSAGPPTAQKIYKPGQAGKSSA